MSTASESASHAAKAKWARGEHRTTVKLHDLTPAQRTLVLALIAAARSVFAKDKKAA